MQPVTKQWMSEERDHEVHVHPLEDLMQHDLDGLLCVCGPKVTLGEGGVIWAKPIVTHASLDGRELHE